MVRNKFVEFAPQIRAIEPHFEEPHADRRFGRAKKYNTLRLFFERRVIRGIDHVATERERPRVYIGNHLSHFDSPFLWYTLKEQGLRVPMIAAGKNLDIDFMKGKLLELDFRRLGGFLVDRNLINCSRGNGLGGNAAYLSALDLVTRSLLVGAEDVPSGFVSSEMLARGGEDVGIFPQGGRNYDGEVLSDPKDAKKFIFRVIAGHNGYDPLDVDIVPFAVDYDKRIEDIVVPLLKKVQGSRKRKDRLLYYGADIGSFVWRGMQGYLGLNDLGNSYLSFGEPFRPSDVDGFEARNWRVLRKETVSRIYELSQDIKSSD